MVWTMPTFEDPDRRVTLRYTLHGPDDGHPILLLAPGGMASTIEAWQRGWVDPHGYLDEYRLVAMDQRNGSPASWGPIEPDHDWSTYTADQLALVDHLGLERFSVLGMCIGGPYGLALCRNAPERIRAAVLFQPLGKSDNQALLDGRFDAWRRDIEAAHPEADDARWHRFRDAMFGGEFVFTVTDDEAATIPTPTLLLAGNDDFHPRIVSDALAARLPDVTYVADWKDDALASATQSTVRRFLDEHTRDR